MTTTSSPLRARRLRRSALLALLAAGIPAAEFHVAATGGNDGTGDGSAGKPYATITRGLEAVVSGRGDTVTVHAGTYRETVRIVKRGASAAAPLRLRAAPGEAVTVSGLDPIGGWSPHSGAIHKTTVTWSLEDGDGDIDADKRDYVSDQLFVDGLPQVYARWPNVPVAQARAITSAHLAQMDLGSGEKGSAGYVSDTQAWFTDAALGSSGLSSATIAGSLITFLPGTKCFARTGRLSAWNGTTATVLAERLNAAVPASGCTFAGAYDFLHAGCDYHLWGKLAYLDAAGEWFRDPATDLLYARMPDSGSPANHLVELRRRAFAIQVDDPSPATGDYDWIEVSGLRVVGATIHVGRNCDGVVFRDLDCRYLTSVNDLRAPNYVPRWPYLAIINGTGCSILDSRFEGCESGIELNGRGNVMRNCVMIDAGANGLAAGVATNLGVESAANDGSKGQRNLVENCTFLGSSYSAIALGAGLDVLANEIVGSHRQGSDLGAISAGPETDTKGVEVAWNLVHDLYPQVIDAREVVAGGPGAFYGSHGIYCDIHVGDALIHHNVTWNTRAAGIALLNSASTRRIWANTVVGRMSVSTLSANTEAKNNIVDQIVDDGGNQRPNGSSPLIAGNLQYLGSEPGWYDAATGDVRLRATSPAIDAGVPLAAVAGTGFTGAYSGGAPDAGAFEGATAWTRVAGAATTPAQLAEVTVAITGSDGSTASARIGGLPIGRHLPANAAIRLGTAAPGGTFRNILDPVTGIYTVLVTGIPVSGSGVQTVQLSGDGGATWLARGSSSVDRLAIDAISGGGGTGFRASGGETITINGHGYAAPAPATWTRAVAIANPAGVTVHGYPVRVTLDTAALIAAGKLQGDGRDLRVSTGDGEIPFWIESGLNTASTALWVRVPRVPAAGTAITLSYGDPARAARSDPRGVFFWYEDFTGLGALPAGFSTPSSTTVGGGKAVVAGTTTSDNAYGNFGFGFDGTFDFPIDGPYLIESLVTVANPTQSGWKGSFGSSDGALGINSGQVAYYNGGWQNLAASTIAIGTPARVGLAVDPTAGTLGWYEGESLRASRSAPRPAIAWLIGPGGSPKSYRLEVDEIRIRPFRSNGPAASVGAETAIPALTYNLTIDGISVPVTRVDERTLIATTPPAPAGALPRPATVQLHCTHPALTATGTITWITTPAAVGGVTVVGGTRQLVVSWSAVPSAASATVRWGPRGGALASSASAIGTTHTITGLADGTTYDVTVEAVNHVGTGPASARVAAITIPAAPTGLAGVVGEGTVAISWVRPTGAATCTLRWGTVSGTWTGTLAGLTGSAASIAPLTDGTPIRVVVSATNAAGTGPLSAEYTITPQAATALPAGAPATVTAVASDSRIDVAWSAVVGAGGYVVRWGPAGGALAASAATTALGHTILGLTNGTAYDVTVEATNSLGAGPASARLTRTPLAGVAPPDPTAEPVTVAGSSGGGGGGGGGCGVGSGLAVVALAALAMAQAGGRRGRR